MNSPNAQNNPRLPREDAEMLIKRMDMEIALRRAKRLSNSGDHRRAVRMLGALLFFALALAAVFTLWRLQTAGGVNLRRHPAGSPAPAASAPTGR